VSPAIGREGGEVVRASRVADLAVAVAIATIPWSDAGQALATSTDYQTAYEIGLRAYTYGLPLVTMNQTFMTMTSTDVSQGAFRPVNQFNSVRSPNNASSTTVVAPGATSLSSIAWLDLSEQPQVLHVPKVTGHYFVMAFIDPYTTNLVNLGTASRTDPGDYVVFGPDQRDVPLPAGTHRLNVDYPRIWIVGSTQVKGASDIAAVNAIQDQYSLMPLEAFPSGASSPATPPAPTDPTITRYDVPTGMEFFDTLGRLLAQFPPPSGMRRRCASSQPSASDPG
jgi:DNA sulfur modification protein DndE